MDQDGTMDQDIMVQGGLAMHQDIIMAMDQDQVGTTDQDIILAMDQDIMVQGGRQDMAQGGLAMDQATDMVVGGLAHHLPRHPLPPPLEAGPTGPSSARDGLPPLLPAQAPPRALPEVLPPAAPEAIPKLKFRPTSTVSRASTTLTTTFTVGATTLTGTWCTSPGASPRAPSPGRTAQASPGP